MTPPVKDWTLGNILATSSAYWQGCTLQAGVRLQLFTALEGSGKTVDELSRELDVDGRGLEHLCNALTAMGLLCRSGSGYCNSEAAGTFLCKNSPTYKGQIILHHHNLVDAWSQLHIAVKEGCPVQERFTSEVEDRENFLLGMFNLAMDNAPRIVPQIDLTGRSHLLDLGEVRGPMPFTSARPTLPWLQPSLTEVPQSLLPVESWINLSWGIVSILSPEISPETPLAVAPMTSPGFLISCTLMALKSVNN